MPLVFCSACVSVGMDRFLFRVRAGASLRPEKTVLLLDQVGDTVVHSPHYTCSLMVYYCDGRGRIRDCRVMDDHGARDINWFSGVYQITGSAAILWQG